MQTGERLTDRKRVDILSAAVSCFSEMGFDNTSMDLIAQQAGVSKRTVYNHFPSKDRLFEAIVSQLKDHAARAVPLCYRSDETLERQLEPFCLGVIEFHCHPDSRVLGRILISRFIRNPQLGHEMFGNTKIFENLLVQWIQSAQKDKRILEGDANFASKQLLMLVEGFCVWPQLILNATNPSKPQKKKIANAAVKMFLQTYRAPSR
ncbi:HTH-type transcriptional regulator RutR [Pirellula sp. SH-Sr6A]|uniref:TetR/AcrR family transcriptional regulator n=1 Tax=Pirellula sp. SH-Sr6A TaxID=1632865 RepID=UPI00078D911D|nr:TetR/AcrR family transcriptional regulator [Pirellula sp. SH-Sr6A]AMV34879.1 HTH-type transcriptional regulator RutR [Pirellula sp. SH-Sr6A]